VKWQFDRFWSVSRRFVVLVSVLSAEVTMAHIIQAMSWACSFADLPDESQEYRLVDR